MSTLTAILLLNGQLTFGLDLSQSYNTGYIPLEPSQPGTDCVAAGETRPRFCQEGAFVNQLRPSASARLLYLRSGYYLEYEGDYTVYRFDIKDSELAHNADLRGRWELGDSTVFEATELAGYGSSNSIRQLDVMTDGSMGLTSARSRFLMNIGRLALNSTLGNTTELAFILGYQFRRTLDNPDTDIPIFNYDGFDPRAQFALQRALNDDNTVGIRLEYGQSFRPLQAAGPMFGGDGIYEATAVLTYRHNFNAELAAGLEAGGVIAGPTNTASESERLAANPADPEEIIRQSAPTGTYVGPAAGANFVYAGSYVQSRARYTYGFGGNGVASSSAAYHEIGLELELQPNPQRPRLTFYGSGEVYRAVEVLAELAAKHTTLEGNAGARYYLTEYLRAYIGYTYRYQTVDYPGLAAELNQKFIRHIATIGLVVDLAMPRHMDAGQDSDEAESSEWWGDVDSEEETERRLRAEERRARERDEELGIDNSDSGSVGGAGVP